jgi:adenine-specific DNA methylase
MYEFIYYKNNSLASTTYKPTSIKGNPLLLNYFDTIIEKPEDSTELQIKERLTNPNKLWRIDKKSKEHGLENSKKTIQLLILDKFYQEEQFAEIYEPFGKLTYEIQE